METVYSALIWGSSGPVTLVKHGSHEVSSGENNLTRLPGFSGMPSMPKLLYRVFAEHWQGTVEHYHCGVTQKPKPRGQAFELFTSRAFPVPAEIVERTGRETATQSLRTRGPPFCCSISHPISLYYQRLSRPPFLRTDKMVPVAEGGSSWQLEMLPTGRRCPESKHVSSFSLVSIPPWPPSLSFSVQSLL